MGQFYVNGLRMQRARRGSFGLATGGTKNGTPLQPDPAPVFEKEQDARCGGTPKPLTPKNLCKILQKLYLV